MIGTTGSPRTNAAAMFRHLPPIRAAILPMAIALIAGCGGAKQKTNDETLPSAVAKVMALRVTIKANGEIQASNSTRIIPAIRRWGTIEFAIPEGQRVRKGETIARINTDEIDRLLKDTELRVSEQQVRFDSARTELEVQEMETAVSLRQAQQDVQSAEKELDKHRKADEVLETRSAQVKIETTRRQLARLERRAVEIAALLKDGFVTEDQVEQEQIAMQEARLAAETAVAEINVLTNYNLPLREARLATALDKAQTEIEKRRKTTAALQRQKQQAVEAATQQLERHKSDLAQYKEEMNACVVTAPSDGLVTYADPNQPWRRSEVQVGGKVSPGQVLMTIPDLSNVKAVVNIPEADATRVATGQPVLVTVDAAANQSFTGDVAKVAEVANVQGWWKADVKEYTADVSLPGVKTLKPGLSCAAEIHVETVENALCVPVQAVFRRDKAFVVYVMENGIAREVQVKTGQSSETHVQITDGIKAGDVVTLVKPSQAQSP
jgi:RND family efflux transporter MFP subunit